MYLHYSCNTPLVGKLGCFMSALALPTGEQHGYKTSHILEEIQVKTQNVRI